MPSMNVGLNIGGGGDKLSVGDNTGQNSLGPSPQPATISWTLAGALAQADFVPMTAAEPGFSWAPPGPRAGIFSSPAVISNGGNTLSIIDTHVDSTSAGEWIYILRVVYNGKVYSTEYTGPGGTTKNPVIINR